MAHNSESARFTLIAEEVTRGDHPHLLVVVDSLHSPLDAPEHDTLNAAISALSKLSRVLNCLVLVVCERNRGAMSVGPSTGAGPRKIKYCTETALPKPRSIWSATR